MKFPDLVHAVKPEPHHAMPQAASAHDTFWDFVSLMPESTHMLMWVMSDRAIPRSYRMMQGFGVHTFRFVNAEGESRFVKFHWKPRGGHAFAGLGRGGEDLRRRSRLPSPRSVGSDRGGRVSRVGARRADLHRGAGRRVQLRRARCDQDRSRGARAGHAGRPHGAQPQSRQLLRGDRAGRVLHRAHRARASTSRTIRCSPGRIHSYVDTQISRLGGPNFHEIPINAPVAQVHNNQRDGMHRQAIPRGRVAYEPNSLGGGCPFQAGARGFTSFPAADGRATRSAASPRNSPSTTTRRRSSGTARAESRRRTSSRAFRFELTKVQTPAVRERVVATLRNVARRARGRSGTRAWHAAARAVAAGDR